MSVQRPQDSYLFTMDTSGIETGVGRTIRTLLEVRQETKAHFLVGTIILGFLSIFKKSQASSPFEALNSVCLSSCQSDMIPPVQMRRRPTAFSRASTGDSDIPSSCDMKHHVRGTFVPSTDAQICVSLTDGRFWCISSQ